MLALVLVQKIVECSLTSRFGAASFVERQLLDAQFMQATATPFFRKPCAEDGHKLGADLAMYFTPHSMRPFLISVGVALASPKAKDDPKWLQG